MEKITINDMKNDIKLKRDCLSLAHEDLKKENDKYNKLIIVVSLVNGMIESSKIQLGLNGDLWQLIPIILSSIIAMISALQKFQDYPGRMEVLIKSSSILTNALNKLRNSKVIDTIVESEYNNSLEFLETSLYPDIRSMFLKKSSRNMLNIMLMEQKYYENITKINNHEKLQLEKGKNKKNDSCLQKWFFCNNNKNHEKYLMDKFSETSSDLNLEVISEEEINNEENKEINNEENKEINNEENKKNNIKISVNENENNDFDNQINRTL